MEILPILPMGKRGWAFEIGLLVVFDIGIIPLPHLSNPYCISSLPEALV